MLTHHCEKVKLQHKMKVGHSYLLAGVDHDGRIMKIQRLQAINYHHTLMCINLAQALNLAKFSTR